MTTELQRDAMAGFSAPIGSGFRVQTDVSVTVAHAAAVKALADSAEALVAAFAAQEEPEKK